jgi:ATP-dependent DNA ligase
LPGPGKGRTAPTKAKTKSSLKLPDFSPPQLCESVDWAHDYEIKFDGYRVQLRVPEGMREPP